MDRNNKMPLYRFKGYIDCWEQRKLGEVYSFSQGQQVPVEEQFEQVNENRIRFIRIVDLTNKGEEMRYIEFKSSTGRVYEKDIFFVRYGAVGVVGIGYDGIIANNLFKLNPLMNVNNKFMYVQFNREKFKKTLQGFSASTTMPAISFTDIRTINISLPTLAEQTAIGNFFQTLDRSIALHQRKLDSLKEQKKTYLQKLFPRNGETIPEIRFPEFQNAPAWEQRKLGEVYSFSQGQQVPVEEQFEQVNENRIRFIRIVDLTNKSEEMRYIEFKSSTGRVYEKDIFFVRYGAVGVVGIGYDGIIANNLFKLNPLMNVNNKFMYVQFNREKFKKTLQGFSASTTMPAISFTDIRTINVYLPTLAEQTAIGTFFQTLDRSIAQHQTKLDKLKESKQTLLKKMFV